MWLVNADFLREEDDETDARGTTGAHHIGDDGRGRVPFELFDDDGNRYFAGVLDDDNEALNQLDALKWGMAFAGCAIIKVRRMYREVVSDLISYEWKQEIG